MRGRSRAGSAKSRRRKQPTSKRASGSEAARPRSSSAAYQEPEVARAKRELAQSRQEQIATTNVLRIISSSSGSLGEVFEMILENAVRICEAKFGILFRVDDGAVHAVAALGLPPALATFMECRHRLGRHTATARAIRTGEAIHVVDFRKEKGYLEGDP